LTRVLWRARLGDRELALTDDEVRPDFEWLPEGQTWWVGLYENRVFGVAANRSSSGDWVAAMIPFDDVTAFDLSNEWWFDIAFVDEGFGGDGANDVVAQEADDATETTSLQMDGQGAVRFSVGDETVTGDELWPEWTENDGRALSRPLVVWFRMVSDMVDLETGEPLEDFRSFALLRTSPTNVWEDFTLSKYEIRKEILGAVLGLGVFFLIGYGLALAAAAAVIYSIARSTSRLTKGAREVERGNLDYRVPVKRKDQLGDLAVSFNSMTDSVQSMLADVAEKERLARELELARRIQESLLPAVDLEAGPLVVRAVFEPAAEVGGDYFDIFTPTDELMIVATGDVAGHGLPAGLLMASLKSTVAALIHEGYSGADLIARVNSLIAGNRQGRTLVTLAVLEFDLEAGAVRLANAGHPPPLLIGPDGAVDELMAGSLPIGSHLSRPSSLERPLPPGSRVLLYSDGLVEAVSEDGEPYGYERLRELVTATGARSGLEIMESIRQSLSEHVGEVPLADDLTLLVIERKG
jgi:serine phosphatase RsbU (regulator of sigma subunit)